MTSQLNSLQEALKLRPEPPALSATNSDAKGPRTTSPDAVASLTKAPSTRVGSSQVDDDNAEPSFYGIEDSVNSALAIGEQTIGMGGIYNHLSQDPRIETHKVF